MIAMRMGASPIAARTAAWSSLVVAAGLTYRWPARSPATASLTGVAASAGGVARASAVAVAVSRKVSRGTRLTLCSRPARDCAVLPAQTAHFGALREVDGGAAQDAVAVVEHHRLPRRDPVLRLVQPYHQLSIVDVRGRRHRRPVRANLRGAADLAGRRGPGRPHRTVAGQLGDGEQRGRPDR